MSRPVSPTHQPAESERLWIRAALPRLLRPRSIAIVGASATPGSFGDTLLNNLERAAFRGDLHLVNPKRAEIRGRPCLASIDALPDGVDCAVLAIPRVAVRDAVAACARRNVGGVVIFSAGFAETGAEGRAAQDELARIAREHGMLLVGPNCLGFVNAVDGVPLTFVVTSPQAATENRRVAILSQSGAMAAVLGVSLRSHGLALSYSISTGNEAVTGVEDYLEYLIEDEHTHVVAMIAEQFRRPRAFLDAVSRARQRGKQIVLLHPGRSSAARAAAATHTGAMAGDYAVMRAKVEHAGVVTVDTLEELLDCSEILIRCPSLPRGGAAVLAESGAYKAMTLDFCEALDLPLPPLGEATAQRLREVLPDFVQPSNPLDLTAHALVDPGLYSRTLPPILADERYGSLVLAIILTDESTGELKLPPIIDALTSLRSEKPILFAALDEGAPVLPAWVDGLRGLGVPFFTTSERALRALARVTAAACRQQAAEPVERHIDIGPVQTELGRGLVPEYRSKNILRRAGIPVPEGGLARTLEEAREIAARIGFPVALKAQSEKLSHKSDAGGVALNLRDQESLSAAWERMLSDLARHAPLDGLLVERMAQPGIELIVGGRNDPDWGPVLLAGFGGVMAEALQDVRLLPAEATPDVIVSELHKLKGAAVLRGFRGSPPVDVEAAASIISRIGALLRSEPSIREVDINPVILYPEGQGAMAVDALIVAGP